MPVSFTISGGMLRFRGDAALRVDERLEDVAHLPALHDHGRDLRDAVTALRGAAGRLDVDDDVGEVGEALVVRGAHVPERAAVGRGGGDHRRQGARRGGGGALRLAGGEPVLERRRLAAARDADLAGVRNGGREAPAPVRVARELAVRREELRGDLLRDAVRESRELADAAHEGGGVRRAPGEEVARALDEQGDGGAGLDAGRRWTVRSSHGSQPTRPGAPAGSGRDARQRIRTRHSAGRALGGMAPPAGCTRLSALSIL
jgi:hypothetical protein